MSTAQAVKATDGISFSGPKLSPSRLEAVALPTSRDISGLISCSRRDGSFIS